MKVDVLGCVTMEKNGPPGDLGDSCAETGRLIVLEPTTFKTHRLRLENFITDKGFIRHPNVPEDWKETDFTSDQALYLLLASYLVAPQVFETVADRIKFTDTTAPDKIVSPDVFFATRKMWNMLAVCAVVQMAINMIPIRWSDAEDRTGFWKYWRFEWNNKSTVSYMTTFVIMTFLKRVSVTWPLWIFPREKYLAKAKAYYQQPDLKPEQREPNTAWFTAFYDLALK